MQTFDWSQKLFDLMANKRVFLQVEGEMGAVDAVLKVKEGRLWRDIAQVNDEETFEAAMAELLKQAEKER